MKQNETTSEYLNRVLCPELAQSSIEPRLLKLAAADYADRAYTLAVDYWQAGERKTAAQCARIFKDHSQLYDELPSVDPAEAWDYEDPWATPGAAAAPAWTEQPVKIPTAAELQELHKERLANLPYKGQPYSVSWCDSEKGWSECACGIIWHYTSACRMPIETQADHCSGNEHSVVFAYVLDDCHCGGGDPYIEHPCIGHDRDGKPFLGPSRMIDPADKY
jgi:hypothetical protein